METIAVDQVGIAYGKKWRDGSRAATVRGFIRGRHALSLMPRLLEMSDSDEIVEIEVKSPDGHGWGHLMTFQIGVSHIMNEVFLTITLYHSGHRLMAPVTATFTASD